MPPERAREDPNGVVVEEEGEGVTKREDMIERSVEIEVDFAVEIGFLKACR
jgi:hypothetical protein